MKVTKVLNNSVVIAKDDNNEECIVFGKAVGFTNKVGDTFEEKQAEKVFISRDKKFSSDLIRLMNEVSPQYLDITERIVRIATETLKVKLNNYIHITLTDHIHFAVIRNNAKENVKNWLVWEVKRFYPKEYKIGLLALDIIKDELGVELPEDEAGNIAFHLVNAQNNGCNKDTMNEITNIIKRVVNIVRYYFQRDLDEASINYSRFVTHLQYFAQRVIENKMLVPEDDILFNQITTKYSEEFHCTKFITEYMKSAYHVDITTDEQLYLTLHIRRIVNRTE